MAESKKLRRTEVLDEVDLEAEEIESEEGVEDEDGFIDQIQELQDELDKVNDEASEKVLEVEQRYVAIRKPVYEKRNEAIKNIPDFWPAAIRSHPVFSQILTDEDDEILKYLDSVAVEEFEDIRSGYVISFDFKPNPFIANASLKKTFHYNLKGSVTSSGTKIEWKQQQNEQVEQGKKRNRSEESFLSWFEVEEVDQDVSEHIDEIADAIKDDLWPNPLRFYISELLGDEEINEEVEGEEGQNEGDQEEDYGEEDIEELEDFEGEEEVEEGEEEGDK